MDAAAQTMAALRAAVVRIEAGEPGGRAEAGRLAFGVEEVDRALGGGLKRGGLHAVTAATAAGAGAATGFAAALAGRAARTEVSGVSRRAVLWIRQDMAGRENGELWPPGLSAIGLDPDQVVTLRARDVPSALKAAETGLASSAVAAAVIEPFGSMGGFDRVAGRRLSLAAARAGAIAFVLRIAPPAGLPTGLLAAETRWGVGPLSSAWAGAQQPEQEMEGWGRPVARVELLRNRLGSLGRWPLAWGYDDGAFRLAERVWVERAGLAPAAPHRPDAGAGAAAHPRARSAEPADRPGDAAQEAARPVRRAG